MTAYLIQSTLRHGRACAALSLVSVLLLAACASGPAAAHGRIVVDSRTMAQVEADEQKRQLEEMRNVNADARRNAEQVQRYIAVLQAEVIDRGLLLTLDDGLFAGNSARPNANGSERLDRLVGFLDAYPYRNAQIESSAACSAGAGYDAALSQYRAAAVTSYLIEQGIAAARLSAHINKESLSINDDCDAHSLYRNRQVIVLIEDVIASAMRP
jgi:outer membrane protein OmpA-like peptidoglycan-associated protein